MGSHILEVPIQIFAQLLPLPPHLYTVPWRTQFAVQALHVSFLHAFLRITL